jgi:Carboxypeptidase regulatory-like domain
MCSSARPTDQPSFCAPVPCAESSSRAIFWPPPVLRAQSDAATVLGRIADESGAVITGAEVTAFNTGSEVKVNTLTNENGIYVLQDLHPGTYDLTVQKNGFRQVLLPNLTLNVEDA